MIQPPSTRAQLFGAPLVGLAMGLLALLFHWSWTGPGFAIGIAAVIGLVLTLAWAHAAWRSSFGARQWLAGAASAALCLGVVASGIGAVAGVLSGTAPLAGWVALSGWATVGVATAVAAWRERHALAREGSTGRWWTQTVDAARGTLGDPFEVPAASLRRDALWLLLPLGVNLPLVLQGLGYREAQWLPVLLAVVSATLIWVCWFWLGPLVGRALTVIDAETRSGQRFVHRELPALQALRRGVVPASARSVPRRHRSTAAPAPLWKRAALVVFQIVAGLGMVGGVTLAVVEAWPALDRSLRWGDYRPAEVVVESVDISARRSQWLGNGRVDGREVRFIAGELDALLGAPPASNNDARLAAARARLPLLAQARWNPQAQRRLIALDAPRDRVDGEARFALALSAALLAMGALGAWAWRALSHRIAG